MSNFLDYFLISQLIGLTIFLLFILTYEVGETIVLLLDGNSEHFARRKIGPLEKKHPICDFSPSIPTS